MPKSNTFYKIISIVVAIILWAYVIGEVNPTSTQTLKDVPIQLINVENLEARGLAISGDMTYKVDVEVEGKRGELAKVTPDEVLANADLFGFTIGKNYIPVTVTVPDSLKVVEVKSAKIIVNIEELVAVSKPVQVNFIGTLKADTEIGNVKAQPRDIEVSGAKSEVSQVAYVRAEVPAENITKAGNKEQAETIAVNADGEPVPNVRLSSHVADVSAKLYAVKEVPLKVEVVGQISSLYEMTGMKKPSTIYIRGTKETLKEITEIKAEPIDISQVTSNATLSVKPILPEDVEVANLSKTLTVEIGVKDMTTRYFDYSAAEIGIEKLPVTLSAKINAEKITIKVSGMEAAMSNLSKKDFQPYINLENAVAGTANFVVLVKHEKQVNYIKVEPAEIQIILSEVQS